jgi:hypothetical protein
LPDPTRSIHPFEAKKVFGRGKSKRDWQLTELGALAMFRAPGFILDP